MSIKKWIKSTIYNSQDTKATSVSISRRMDKEDVVYIYNGILLSHKKEWSLAICDNMSGARGYYAKWNKSDRERTNAVWFHLYVESKRQNKWTNITKQKQSHRYREQVIARGEMGRRRKDIGGGD